MAVDNTNISDKMKRRIQIIAILTFFAALFFSFEADSRSRTAPGDTLRILAIGNSFSDDGMMYLPDLLEDAGIKNVILGRLYIGGCSLERHCKEYRENLHDYTYYKSEENKWKTVKKGASILDGLKDEKWDIVTMQQSSPVSGLEASYTPWLHELIGIVRSECPNPDAETVWHQTWAYAINSTHSGFAFYGNSQSDMFNAICVCVRKLMKEENIKRVIPTGTAVQNLRRTRLNDESGFTRDGFHLSKSYGRYLAACVWFEALIKPAEGVSVKKCRFHLEGTENEISPKDAALCRRTAAKTVRTAFK